VTTTVHRPMPAAGPGRSAFVNSTRDQRPWGEMRRGILAALADGPQPAAVIARAIGCTRGRVATDLSRMQRAGLVERLIRSEACPCCGRAVVLYQRSE
jgi:predicted Rossmann fold nucleotide-binding protein DprA/Smf involved in DNA uptake